MGEGFFGATRHAFEIVGTRLGPLPQGERAREATPPGGTISSQARKRGSRAKEWSPLSRGRTDKATSPPGAGERVHPAHHARSRVLDILLAEEVLGLDPVDRIDRAEK